MNCGKAQLRIQAMADGELTGWRARRLDRHLLRCDRCAAELAFTERVKRFFTEHRNDLSHLVSAGADSPEFFWSQVRRRLGESESKGILNPSANPWVGLPRYGRAGFVMAVTAAVVMFLGVTLLWESGRLESVEWGPSEVSDVKTPFSNTHHLTYIAGDSGTTFIWIYGLPTESEEEETEL